MLFRVHFKIVCLLIMFCFVLINAKNYNKYPKTTPKPMTPKPPKPTPKPKPPAKPTQKPKPSYYPPAAPPTAKPTKPPKPTKAPSYPSSGMSSYPSGGGSGGSGSGGGKPSKGMPYKFEYSANVGSPDPTGMIAQSESGDANGVVTGMYSLRDPDGRERTVMYKADSTGFHATVETNELPPDVPNPADVTIIGSGPAPSMMSSGSTSAPSSGSQSGYYYTTEGGSTPEPSTEGTTEGTTQGGYY